MSRAPQETRRRHQADASASSRIFLLVFAGDRAVRRRLPDLQHLHDPGRPAAARARPAARARRQPAAGRPSACSSRRSSSAARRLAGRPRGRRAGRDRAARAAQRLRRRRCPPGRWWWRRAPWSSAPPSAWSSPCSRRCCRPAGPPRIPPVAAMRDAERPRPVAAPRARSSGAVLLAARRRSASASGCAASCALLGARRAAGLPRRRGAVARCWPGRSPGCSARRCPAGCPAGSAGSTRCATPAAPSATAAALMVGLALVSAVSIARRVAQGLASSEIVARRGRRRPDRRSRAAAEFAGRPQPRVGDGRGRAARRSAGVDVLRFEPRSSGTAGRVRHRGLDRRARHDGRGSIRRAGELAGWSPRRSCSPRAAATDLGLAPGDELTVRFTRRRAATYTVAGTYADNQLVGGYLFDESVVAGLRDLAGRRRARRRGARGVPAGAALGGGRPSRPTSRPSRC